MMELPAYRDTSDLPTLEAKAGFDALERKEPVSFATRLAFLGRTLYLPDPGDPVAAPEIREQATAAGFTYLGRYSFAGIFGRPKRERWLAPNGLASAGMKSASSLGQMPMSAYYISTTFDDGAAVVTWSQAAPLQNRARAFQLSGTGVFLTDWTQHMIAVRARAEEGRTVLRQRDMEDALRSSTWYETRLDPSATIGHLQIRATLLAAMGYEVYKLMK